VNTKEWFPTDEVADMMLWFSFGYLSCLEKRTNYLSHITERDEWISFDDNYDLHIVTTQDTKGVWGTSVTVHDPERENDFLLI
jgi:hypothetical protein